MGREMSLAFITRLEGLLKLFLLLTPIVLIIYLLKYAVGFDFSSDAAMNSVLGPRHARFR